MIVVIKINLGSNFSVCFWVGINMSFDSLDQSLMNRVFNFLEDRADLLNSRLVSKTWEKALFNLPKWHFFYLVAKLVSFIYNESHHYYFFFLFCC